MKQEVYMKAFYSAPPLNLLTVPFQLKTMSKGQLYSGRFQIRTIASASSANLETKLLAYFWENNSRCAGLQLNSADVDSSLKWRLETFDHDGSPDLAQHDLLDKNEVKLVAYCELQMVLQTLDWERMTRHSWPDLEVHRYEGWRTERSDFPP